MTRDSDLANTILLIGHGRSGTTWLMDTLNANRDYRLIFEPYNRKKNKRIEHFEPKYTRPQLMPEDTFKYENIVRDVLMGKTASVDKKWVNRIKSTNPTSDRRIVKEIVFGRMAGWLQRHFPQMKILLIVRDPFSAAFSATTRGWMKESPIEKYAPPQRIADAYLSEKQLKVFLDAKTQFQRNIAMWAMDNFLLLKQIQPTSNVTSVYYESLVRYPDEELGRLAEFCGHTYVRLGDKVRKKSKTSTKESVTDPNDAKFGRSWEGNITKTDEAYAKKILSAFGLAGLYKKRNVPAYSEPLDWRESNA